MFSCIDSGVAAKLAFNADLGCSSFLCVCVSLGMELLKGHLYIGRTTRRRGGGGGGKERGEGKGGYLADFELENQLTVMSGSTSSFFYGGGR